MAADTDAGPVVARAAAAGPPSPSLRALCAAVCGAAVLLAALAIGFIVAGEAAGRAEAEAAHALRVEARHLATRFDRTLAEAWRDLIAFAALPGLRDPAAGPDQRTVLLTVLVETHPSFARIVLLDRDLQPVAMAPTRMAPAEGGGLAALFGPALLEAARRQPIAAELSPSAAEAAGSRAPAAAGTGVAATPAAVRTVGLAVPVLGPDGTPVGILAAQLERSWARGVVGRGFEPEGGGGGGAVRSPPEPVLLARDGTVLLGPTGLAGHRVAAGPGGIAWPEPDHRAWLTAVVPIGGEAGGGTGDAAGLGRHLSDLGWTVVLRQDVVAQLRAPAMALRRSILLWSGVAAAAAALLGWLAAGRIVRPLRALAEAAERLRRDSPPDRAGPPPPPPRSPLLLPQRGAGLAELRRLDAGLAALMEEGRASARARESAVAALAASEERLRLAQEAGGIGAWELDIATRGRRWSESNYRLWGLDPATPLDLDRVMDAIHPADRARVREAVQRAAETVGALHEVEFRVHRGTDGALRWLRSRGETLAGPDGRPARLVGVMRDVTRRKQVEAALAEREARLRQLGDNLPGGAIYQIEQPARDEAHDGAPATAPRFRYWSRGIEAMTGVSPEEALRDPRALYALVHPDDLPALVEAERRAAAERTPIDIELRQRHRSGGEYRWYRIVSSLSGEADGKLVWNGVQLDVTERRRAIALRERYRLLMRQARDIVLLVRPADGAILDANDAAVAAYGYTREELLRMRVHALRAPETRGAIADQLAASQRGGILFETLHLRRDGSRFPVEVSAVGAEVEGERFAVSVVRDITERRLAAARLREREAQLARVQRIGRIGGFEIDLAGGGAGADAAAGEELLLRTHFIGGGRLPELPAPPQDPLSDSGEDSGADWLAAHIPAEDRERVQRVFRAAVQDRAMRDCAVEYRVVDPDGGGTRWISTVAEIERDAAGAPLRMVGAHLDVTALKAAQEALRAANEALEQRVAERTAELAASEAELARIYHRTPAAFHSVGPEGTLIRVSDEWLAFLGHAREEVIGRRIGTFMAPESAVRWEAALAELRATPPGVVREVEYRMLRKDGTPFDVLLRSRGEYDAEGRFLRSYSVLVDVTERNRAEAALRESQKLEALGRVAGGVAHDFNNLLQVVTGALRLIESRADRVERVRRYAAAALEAAERGADLTRRMLAFARREDLHADALDPAAVLEGMRALLRGSLGPSIRVAVEAPPGLPPLRADRAQLDLVLFNLALNARDAIQEGRDEGGGTIRLSAAMEAVGAGEAAAQTGLAPGLAPGRYLRLAVHDDGAGMDGATLARATEPFFTTKEIGKGTGLGLSMAYGFAAQSGGRLAIESAPGRGTTVTLWLPAAETGAAPAAGAADAAVPPSGAAEDGGGGAGLTVLLVDDEPGVRATLAEALGEAGFRVALAERAATALARLEGTEHFDVVVTDLAMPGMSGAALVAELARRRPGLPVLLLTGDAAAAGHAPDGPAPAAVLHKPVSPEALVRALRDLLRGGDAPAPPAAAPSEPRRGAAALA